MSNTLAHANDQSNDQSNTQSNNQSDDHSNVGPIGNSTTGSDFDSSLNYQFNCGNQVTDASGGYCYCYSGTCVGLDDRCSDMADFCP